MLNLTRLKRMYWNWRRKRRRIRPDDVPAPFFHASTINDVHEYFSTHHADPNVFQDAQLLQNNKCFVCNALVKFSVNLPMDGSPVNWRETLTCPKCELINRWRGCVHVFEAVCEPTVNDRIYLTEILSPLYQNLASRFPLLSASEFLSEGELGSLVNAKGVTVRNEDVTQLTFRNRSFESILCFDVMEHVPDYRLALKEFFRVLSSGGQLLLSVPFSFRQETVVRAEIDQAGQVRHLLEPSYHGDPLSNEGVLSYYDFGMDLLDELSKAGFKESFLLCYRSKEWGYMGENIVYVARKI